MVGSAPTMGESRDEAIGKILTMGEGWGIQGTMPEICRGKLDLEFEFSTLNRRMMLCEQGGNRQNEVAAG
jgi:hypothetical protein